MTQGRREIQERLAAAGVRARRDWGQNFLADPNLVDRIVRLAAVGPRDHVVEIGAGTGALTRALASTDATVIAYEIDERLRPILDETLEGTRVDVRFVDIMAVDLAEELGGGTWTMVANLPYNIGTPLLLDTLRHVPAVDRMIVMVQREVAERLVAEPSDPAYGLPSVVCRLHATARIAFTAPPEVFFPRPAVESAVMELRRVAAPPGSETAIAVAARAFNQRRKMLRRSLAGLFDEPVAVLERCGIDPTARPQDLTTDQFLRIAGAT